MADALRDLYAALASYRSDNLDAWSRILAPKQSLGDLKGKGMEIPLGMDTAFVGGPNALQNVMRGTPNIMATFAAGGLLMPGLLYSGEAK